MMRKRFQCPDFGGGKWLIFHLGKFLFQNKNKNNYIIYEFLRKVRTLHKIFNCTPTWNFKTKRKSSYLHKIHKTCNFTANAQPPPFIHNIPNLQAFVILVEKAAVDLPVFQTALRKLKSTIPNIRKKKRFPNKTRK